MYNQDETVNSDGTKRGQLHNNNSDLIADYVKPCNYATTSSNSFQYMHVDPEIVAQNIDEYIIPECQEACKKLWDKNIFTFMCSNREDGNLYYVQFGAISPENEQIFKKLLKSAPDNYFYSEYRSTYGISVFELNSDNASTELTELVSPFIMQDVLEGYQDIEDFLITKFGMSKSIHNPDFVIDFKEPQMEDFSDATEFLSAYDEWIKASCIPETIEVFDKSKMEKPIEEYLSEAGVLDLYDPERGIIYNSNFYRAAHLRYLDSIKQKGSSPLKERENALTYEEYMADQYDEIEKLLNRLNIRGYGE